MKSIQLRSNLIIPLALSALFAIACNPTEVGGEVLDNTDEVASEVNRENIEITTLYVGSEQVDCEGVAIQKCLLVKEDINSEYEYFYDSIEGFEWQAGYEYELLVAVAEIGDPPADGAAFRYQLVEIVNRVAIPSEEDLSGTDWKLRAFSLNDVWREPLDDSAVTISFADGRFSGSAGCNTFLGSYTQAGNQLVISDMGVTQMACEDDLAEQEALFLEALELANAISFEENSLWIEYGENVAIVLDRYQPID